MLIFWKWKFFKPESYLPLSSPYQSSAIELILHQIIHNLLFSNIDADDDTLEFAYSNKKRILLPAETWHEIFKFVPFNDLHVTVPFVCSGFNHLATSVYGNLWPRIILSVRICWDGKRKLHRTFANRFPEKWDIPSTPPPSSILGIGRISIEGRIDKEVLRFLKNCNKIVTNCELDFVKFDNFMAAIGAEEISLDGFFASLTHCCSRIRIDASRSSFLSSEFLSHPFVLNCPFIHIYRPIGGFDPNILIRWLMIPSEFGLKQLELVEIYENTQMRDQNSRKSNELIEEMIGKIIALAREESNAFASSFSLKIENYEVSLKEFNHGFFSLRLLNANTWLLLYNGNKNNGSSFSKLNLAPKCKIEIDILGRCWNRKGWRKWAYSVGSGQSFRFFAQILKYLYF